MRVVRPAAYAVTLLLIVTAASAQTVPDLTGTWELSSQVQLSDVAGPCVFAGQATITQDGTEIFGTANQALVSGPAACPAEMMANLSGYFDVGRQQVVLTGSLSGDLGATSFSGQISRDQGGGGSFAVTQGPFAGVSGSWAARLRQQLEAIPALTPVGLTVLVLLVLGIGALLLRRRQPA